MISVLAETSDYFSSTSTLIPTLGPQVITVCDYIQQHKQDQHDKISADRGNEKFGPPSGIF